MDTLRIPLTFRSNGTAVALTEGSDEYYSQLLSLIAQIQPRELVMTPTFGTPDPTFNDQALEEFAYTATSLIPEITLEDLQITETPEGKAQIQISFSVKDQQS